MCWKSVPQHGNSSDILTQFSDTLFAESLQLRLQLLGNLSNHDGNAKENVTLKMNSKHFKLFRDSFNSFNLSYVAE